MPIGHLWYVRRGTETRGPFPARVIERNIGLGRINVSDWVSPEGESWLPASEYPDFAFRANNARDPVLAARMNERQVERRAATIVEPPKTRPSLNDGFAPTKRGKASVPPN
ncbi:MAG: hypothetical protein EXR86_10425 [Gammaproteobacteria bacterium]|nr:hypothetical protein [Gammaproteobacteria bacterium]